MTAPDSDPRPFRSDELLVQQPVIAQPVIAQPVIAQPAVQQPVAVAPAVEHQSVQTSSQRRFNIDSLIVGIIGLAATIVGLIVVTRAGVDGPMNQPVVKVLGDTHTATLGAIEIGIGVCLLVSAALTSRAAAIFFGLLLGVGSVVGAVQSASFHNSLALQPRLAWTGVVAAAVVVLVSLLSPRTLTEQTGTRQSDVRF